MRVEQSFDTRRKILGREELEVRLDEHRARGERVVVATGGFDLLQGADVDYLEGARREGDVLVVAVDSNAQLRSRKGSDRPIVPAEGRAQLVAALSAVRYVILRWDGDGPTLLDVLRPDVYAANGNPENASEREAARRAGIRIVSLGRGNEDTPGDVVQRLRSLPHG
jgi:D-beta-D-heptose 7-phosphate kinase / D-beta-D-heptose 1-phosphate adenosyltransferase